MKSDASKLIFLGLMLILALLANISLGSVYIPFQNVLSALTGSHSDAVESVIIRDFRLVKAITAALCGMGLAVSGLLMQTLFRNPLAGPYVLGVSSGAGLGVALVVLGAPFLPYFLSHDTSLVVAAALGSFAVLAVILSMAQYIKNTMALLIIGLMFGSISNALISVLAYFSSAEAIQRLTFWSMGNISNLTFDELSILSVAVFIGLGLSFLSIKPLNALLLGENYAVSMGIPLKRSRYIIIFATCILAGSITAYAGPIAFIGLAVPHLVKLWFQTSQHRVLFWGSILMGALVLSFCDLVSQVPGYSWVLPINAITSIVGAPVVIYLIVRRKKMLL